MHHSKTPIKFHIIASEPHIQSTKLEKRGIKVQFFSLRFFVSILGAGKHGFGLRLL